MRVHRFLVAVLIATQVAASVAAAGRHSRPRARTRLTEPLRRPAKPPSAIVQLRAAGMREAAASHASRGERAVQAGGRHRVAQHRLSRRLRRSIELGAAQAVMLPSRVMTDDKSVTAATVVLMANAGGGLLNLPLMLIPGAMALKLFSAAILTTGNLSRLRKKRSRGEAGVDTLPGMAWGIQLLTAASSQSHSLAGTIASGAGVGGGAVLSAVGLNRIRKGIASREPERVILGAADTVVGGAWIMSSVAHNPTATWTFLVLGTIQMLWSYLPSQRAAREPLVETSERGAHRAAR